MKSQITALLFLLTTLNLISCNQKKETYVIGVSQCSEDSCRQKLKEELEIATYFNNGVSLRFASANETKLGNSETFLRTGLDQTVKINGSCRIILSNDSGEEFAITYDQKAMTLSGDHCLSGLTDFSQHFNVPVTAPLVRKLTSLRIFVDNSSIEVFGNNGEVCLTNLVFPSSPLNTLTFSKNN